jgi:hypothetical protein
VVSLVKSWPSQPDPDPEIAADRRELSLATALANSALARGLATASYTTHWNTI